MATYLHDIGSSIATATNVSLPPNGARTSTANGTTIDLIAGDGLCNVVITAGTITDGTHTITVQESTTTSDADFTAVTLLSSLTALSSSTTAGTTQYAAFNRTKRYVRAVTTVAGTSSGGCYSVNIFEQKKFVV